MKPSLEQQNIINAVLDGKNVKISAVAGSGKTTTSIFVANSISDKNVLLLTFSRPLTNETTNKLKDINIKNMKALTFHSFFTKLYKTKCFENKDLKNILDSDIKVNSKNVHLKYDLIIIDEAQDLDPLLYEVLIKTLCLYFREKQLIVLGDENQAIFQFKESTQLFLINYDKFFNINSRQWVECKLSQSFRITKQMANFVSDVFFKDSNYMSSPNSIENSVAYIVCDMFDTYELFNFLKSEFEKYDPEQIFILNNSWKSGNSLPYKFKAEIENRGFKIYKADTEFKETNEKLLKNKIYFSTYHTSKGMEKELVILFGLDNAYYEYVAKNDNPLKPANVHYVALTRAKQKLVILHHYQNEPLKFIDIKKLNPYIIYQNDKMKQQFENAFLSEENNNQINTIINNNHFKLGSDNNPYPITDLVNFINPLNFSILNKIKIEKGYLKYDGNLLDNITNIVEREDDTYENVSSINGILLPLIIQSKRGQIKNTIDQILQMCKMAKDKEDKDNPYVFLKKDADKFIKILSNIDYSLFDKKNIFIISLLKSVIDNSNSHLYRQVKKIDWIYDEDLLNAENIFNSFLSLNTEFEVGFEINQLTEFAPNIDPAECNLLGFVDAIDHENKIVYEFKFTDNLNDSNRLQLLLYKYLILKQDKDSSLYKLKDYSFILANIKTLEFEIIKISDDDLEQLFIEVVREQFRLKTTNQEPKMEDLPRLLKILDKYR